MPPYYPCAVRLELKVVPLDLAVLGEAPREVPAQTVLVVGPYVRVYFIASKGAVGREAHYLV